MVATLIGSGTPSTRRVGISFNEAAISSIYGFAEAQENPGFGAVPVHIY
jgi:hypothetical protein